MLFDVFIPVWFNPWRYEKEEHLIIPFLKTIQHAIEAHLERHKAGKKKLSKEAITKLKKLKDQISKITFALISSLEGELDLQVMKCKLDLSKVVNAAGKIEDAQKRKKEIAELEEYRSVYYDAVEYLKKVSGNLMILSCSIQFDSLFHINLEYQKDDRHRYFYPSRRYRL